MASKHEWIVIIPDKPGMLDARIKIRPTHIAGLKPNIEAGFILMGGASLDGPIQEGQGPQANGSVVMVCAEDKGEILEKLSKDPYVAAGVWDLDRAQIIPFKCAVRVPM